MPVFQHHSSSLSGQRSVVTAKRVGSLMDTKKSIVRSTLVVCAARVGSTLVRRNAATSGRIILYVDCPVFIVLLLLWVEPVLIGLDPWKSIRLLIHAIEKLLDALIPITQL